MTALYFSSYALLQNALQAVQSGLSKQLYMQKYTISLVSLNLLTTKDVNVRFIYEKQWSCI